MFIVTADSSDGSEFAASQISNNDPRVQVLKQNGTGIYGAMNIGLTNSTSKYIWFMNSGDIFAGTQTLAFGLQEIEEKKVGVVVGGYGVGDGNKLRFYSGSSSILRPSLFSLNRRLGCHQSMIYDRELLISVGGYDENFTIAADFLATLRVIVQGKGWRTATIYSIIEPGGISSARIKETLEEKQRAREIFFGVESFEFKAGMVWSRAVLIRIALRTWLQNLIRASGF
jgi:glycosyltransferase involved in cell wall biosynthesis